MRKYLLIVVFAFCCGILWGCASQQESASEEQWSKEVVVYFSHNIRDFQIQQFLNRNQLEMVSEYDDFTVRARIRSGESVADLIERVKNDPYVDNIQEYSEKK